MIPLFRPSYGAAEVEAVRHVLESGWSGLGAETARFEAAFAQYLGAPGAVALNSGTAALHLAMVLAEVRGYEVITTPLTFISTNHSILYAGGIPVFADVQADTGNIDPDSVAARVTSRTRAIMCVHYGGRACDMRALSELAGGQLVLVEDAAHACGGAYRQTSEDQPVKLGTIGTLGCFSFHAVKNLSCGDGGALVCSDLGMLTRARRLRWLGIDRTTHDRSGPMYRWDYNVAELGYKYHMNDITAAIASVQLSKLGAANARRAAIADQYTVAFARSERVKPLMVYPYMQPCWHNYVVRCVGRDNLIAFLNQHGISAGVHYRPSNHYVMYNHCAGPTPVCDRLWVELVSLPIYPDMTDEQVAQVISTVNLWENS